MFNSFFTIYLVQNLIFCKLLYCLARKLSLKLSFRPRFYKLTERYEDISVIKCKNSEFYLLEPLESPGLIRSFFSFVRRNFEQLEVPRKNTANQVTGQPKCCPPREEGSLSVRALVKELYSKLFSRWPLAQINRSLVGCVFPRNFELLEVPPDETEKRSN